MTSGRDIKTETEMRAVPPRFLVANRRKRAPKIKINMLCKSWANGFPY
jgi:hypothetical protein